MADLTPITARRRQLSLHERFSVARRNCGFPHHVIYLLSYPSDRLPTLEALSTRIKELQKHFPLLSSVVVDGKTRHPAFELREQWSAGDVLSTLEYMPNDDESLEQATLLRAEIDRVEPETTSDRPLWQVTRYNHTTSTRAYLALSVDHTLTDGRGGLNLLQALVTPTIDDLPYEDIITIPKLEDTHSLKPSSIYLASMVFQELLVPCLPVFIQRYLKPYASWPSGIVSRSPIDCTSQVSILSLSPELLSSLKRTGKTNGVQTLHPILKLSYGIAIWAVHHKTYTQPFSLSLQTPSSVRDTSKSHSYCTANYTASNTFDLLPISTTSFWVEARKIASTLSSPLGKARALESMGLLAYIPDPESSNSSPPDPKVPTGWESYLFNAAGSTNPFPGSLGFSNLGFVGLPEGAVDLVWSQVVSPFAPVYEVNVGSCERGLRAVSTWREGSGTTRKEVEEVERVWERVLRRLVDSRGEVTLGDLVAKTDEGK